MPLKLLSPDAVREAASKKFAANRNDWLAGVGEWPIAFSLGTPTQRDMAASTASIGAWVEQWRSWSAPGTRVVWEDRSWPVLGQHHLPARVLFDSPEAMADVAQASDFWNLVRRRRDHLISEWPQLNGHPVLRTRLEVLAAWTDNDFERLVALLAWLLTHPRSNLYVRQVPVPGLDTKWAGEHRGAVLDFLRALRGDAGEQDFYEVCGLRRPAPRVRLRILCGQLAELTRGLRDVEVPVAELAQWGLTARQVFIVENLETGLALPEMTGSVAFMKLGFAVGLLRDIEWVQSSPAVYWGDIDTHGFAILNRARQALPHLTSALMDEPTVETFRDLGVREPKQFPNAEMTMLNAKERQVVEGLYLSRWGENFRLEQERLPWEYCLEALQVAH